MVEIHCKLCDYKYEVQVDYNLDDPCPECNKGDVTDKEVIAKTFRIKAQISEEWKGWYGSNPDKD